MISKLKTLLAVIAIAGVGLAGAPSAEAATIRIFDGVTTVDIADNSAEDDNPVVGEITHTGALGAFIDLEIALTKPSVGSTTSPTLQLNFLAASFSPSVATALQISFSEDDFGPTSPFLQALATGTTSGQVNYTTLQDPGNSLFGGAVITSNTTLAPGPFTLGPSAGLILGDTSFPYSLTQQFTIIHPASPFFQQTQVDFSILLVAPSAPTVPDGGWAVGLLGFALVGVEGLRRKYTRI